MKTNSLFSFLQKMMVLVTLICLSACQKEAAQDLVAENSAIAQENKQEAVTKVNAWLENQKKLTTAVIATSVNNIKANLDFDKLYFEKLSETEKLLIVPLKSTFVSTVNKGKNPLNVFLLVLNKEGDIRKGNIVQFISKNSVPLTALPKNTFYNFYNADHLVADGSFTFLNVYDKILYQMDYKDGKISAYSEKQNKQDNNIANSTVLSTTTACTNWYWVTTYADGTQSWQFLYTTCSGDESVEPEGGGSGGGGGNGEEEVTMAPKQEQWIVAVNASFLWYVNSTEQLNGVKKPNLPGGGYFTNITHLGENVVDGGNAGYVWNRSGVTVSYGGSSAQSTVSGILKSPSYPDVNIPPKTNTFAFSQVYP
jgi:hypothetical protein